MKSYSPVILEHFQNPRHTGTLPAGKNTGTGVAESPANHAVVRIQVELSGNIISQTAFQAQACVNTIACASWLCEWARGKTTGQVNDIQATDIADTIGLEQEDLYSAILAEDALRQALGNVKQTS